MSIEDLTLKQRFEFVREIVKHEDTLTNFRTTWALVFQGLLFSAFVSAAGLINKLRFPCATHNPVVIGMYLLCALGAASALAGWFGLRAAERQLEVTTDWWEDQLTETTARSYPPVFRHGTSPFKLGASVYFVVLSAAWLGLALTLACAPSPAASPAPCETPSCDCLK